MKNDHYSGWLTFYLDGQLDKEQEREVEAHLNTCPSCSEELQEYKALLMAFDDEKNALPDPALEVRFYENLENMTFTEPESPFARQGHTSRRRFPLFPVLKAAAGIALLIGAFMLGRWGADKIPVDNTAISLEETATPEPSAIFSLAEDRSASKRIQAVHYLEEITSPDAPVLDALIRRMLLDENMNVRRTAVDALEKFKTHKKVTEAYLHALETEKNPAIQIAVIQILIGIREKKAAPAMRQLMDQEDTKSFVKEQIRSLLPIIA